MKPDPKIRAIARPIRVAFLIEDGPDSHNWLDSVFDSCFSRHGGRQSLVIPVEGGVIQDRYAHWLRVLDPDLVITLTYENPAYVEALTRLLGDSKIISQDRNREVPEKHPRVFHEPRGLTALSWLPFLKASAGGFRRRPELILDSYPSWIDDGFMRDNFGSLATSLQQFPVHQELIDFIQPLLLTPHDAPEDRWRFGITGQEEIIDPYEILPRLRGNGGLITLGYLSNLYSQPLRIEHSWNRSFCVVVGDSFLDRVSCWNAALLYDDAQHQWFKSIRVPTLAIRKEDVVRQLGGFLGTSNWIGQNNCPAKVTIRSHSLSQSELNTIATQLNESSRQMVDAAVIRSPEDCCPIRDADIHKIRSNELGTTQIALSEGCTVVGVPIPMQVKHCAGVHPIFSQGEWYVDLDIDRVHDNSGAENIRESWVLPNKPQLVSAFHTQRPARILRCGKIGVRVNCETAVLEINQPDDEKIFRSILHEAAHYDPNDLRRGIQPVPVYKYSEPSDKGRYLQGVIGMFGTLESAKRILSGHFWRAQFEKLAVPAKDQKDWIITFLQRRLNARSGSLTISDEAGWHQLAERVIQSTKQLKQPRIAVRYNSLLKAWEEEIRAAIDENQQLKQGPEEDPQEVRAELNRSLEALCRRGVFHRGHEWVCHKCSHTNWASIDSLRNTLPCEICQTMHQLPVDLSLCFRLNEFLAACIREHDTMTVIWALSELRDWARTSFVYSPQMSMYCDYPENQGMKVDRELDVLCIVDGQFVIGEAKQRAD